MNMRTPIKEMRGLGSAKDGTHHWWAQRMTALGLIPLSFWFVFSMVSLIGASHAEFTAWMAEPMNAILMLLFLPILVVHSMQGLQVIMEDYIDPEWLKVTCVILMQFVHYFLGAASIVAILRLAIGG